MIQVRHTTIDARAHIEIRCGPSPARLHTCGTLNMDEHNAATLLGALGSFPVHIEIVEVDR